MPPDIDRIFTLLDGINRKLDDLQQRTEQRLSALEERGSAERFKLIEQNQRETDREVTALRTQVKIYVALAGACGAIAGPVILKFLG